MSVDDRQRDNADLGLTVETAACDRWPALVHVANDPKAPDWYDAITAEPIVTGPDARLSGLTVVDVGTPIEIKSCVEWIGDHDRRGRWWFREGAHERLLAAGGEYVLAVRDGSSGLLRVALTPASTVDVLLEGRWTSCGRHHEADRSAQLPWGAAFDTGGESRGD